MRSMIATETGAQRDMHLVRGVLEMCVLATLAMEPTHAYDIVQRLRMQGFESVGYGTVYPLVARLRRQGLLDRQAYMSRSGPTRQVLRLSDQGEKALGEWRTRWEAMSAAAARVLNDCDRAR